MGDLHASEKLFEYAARLVAENPEITTVVTESVRQNTDLDTCAGRYAVTASDIAEDLVHFLLEAGWSPPRDDTATAGALAKERDHYKAMWEAARSGNTQLLHKLGEAEQLAGRYRDLLHAVWLYVDWRYVTGQLTTEQKELWADAVKAVGSALDPDEPPLGVDRWWRPDRHNSDRSEP